MKESDFAWLLGSDVAGLGVTRFRRTSLECLRLADDGKQLLVVQLLFLNVSRSELSLVAPRPTLGSLRSIRVGDAAEAPGCIRSFEIAFDAGVWTVEAESCCANCFSSIPHAD